jgi:hypothetical protein
MLPVPPPALQARYGSHEDRSMDLEPGLGLEPRSRTVLRALALIGGGVVLGVALVASAVIVHRAWTSASVPASVPARVPAR